MSKRNRKSNDNNENTRIKRSKAIARASSSKTAAVAAASGGEVFPRPEFLDAKTLASTLLSWLPPDSTSYTKDSKLLLQAMDIVRAKLDHNALLMAQSSLSDGRQSAIIITTGRVIVPPDVLMNVLSYLKPCSELVHTASLVAKSWLAVTRSTQLWHTLDSDHGLHRLAINVTNMDDLLELLQRPQFASLKTLIAPDKVQVRVKAPSQIAKCCPLLERIDFGFSPWSKMKLDENALLQLPTLFPHLNAVGFNNYKISDSGLRNFCGVMGDRLLSLRIRDSYNSSWELSDETLIECISQHCPNLEQFDYHHWPRKISPRPTFSDNGVIHCWMDVQN